VISVSTHRSSPPPPPRSRRFPKSHVKIPARSGSFDEGAFVLGFPSVFIARPTSLRTIALGDLASWRSPDFQLPDASICSTRSRVHICLPIPRCGDCHLQRRLTLSAGDILPNRAARQRRLSSFARVSESPPHTSHTAQRRGISDLSQGPNCPLPMSDAHDSPNLDDLTPEEASRIIHSHRKVRYGEWVSYPVLVCPYPASQPTSVVVHNPVPAQPAPPGDPSASFMSCLFFGLLSGQPMPPAHVPTGTACWPCRQRKVKCDNKAPCENCVKREHPGLCSYKPNRSATGKSGSFSETNSQSKKRPHSPDEQETRSQSNEARESIAYGVCS